VSDGSVSYEGDSEGSVSMEEDGFSDTSAISEQSSDTTLNETVIEKNKTLTDSADQRLELSNTNNIFNTGTNKTPPPEYTPRDEENSLRTEQVEEENKLRKLDQHAGLSKTSTPTSCGAKSKTQPDIQPVMEAFKNMEGNIARFMTNLADSCTSTPQQEIINMLLDQTTTIRTQADSILHLEQNLSRLFTTQTDIVDILHEQAERMKCLEAQSQDRTPNNQENTITHIDIRIDQLANTTEKLIEANTKHVIHTISRTEQEQKTHIDDIRGLKQRIATLEQKTEEQMMNNRALAKMAENYSAALYDAKNQVAEKNNIIQQLMASVEARNVTTTRQQPTTESQEQVSHQTRQPPPTTQYKKGPMTPPSTRRQERSQQETEERGISPTPRRQTSNQPAHHHSVDEQQERNQPTPKLRIALIGASNTRKLDDNQLSSDCWTVRKIHSSNCESVQRLTRNPSPTLLEADHIIVHTGTHDIEHLKPKELHQQHRQAVLNLRQLKPQANITVSAILPRRVYYDKISKINAALKW
jgi:hypothetical protein